jgi:hypothetical protein
MLIVQSDQEPTLARFNNEVFIPELRAAGKDLDVKSFTGEPHCFAFNGQAAQPANAVISTRSPKPSTRVWSPACAWVDS